MAKRSLFDDLTDAERDAFVARIRELVGKVGTQAEAARVAGVSIGQLKAYVAGRSAPSFLPIAKLAHVAGVDLNAILPTSATPGAPNPPVRAPKTDAELMGRLIDSLSKVYREMGVALPELELGRIASHEYDDLVAAGAANTDEQIAMVRLVSARHRRQLEQENLGARKRGA